MQVCPNGPHSEWIFHGETERCQEAKMSGHSITNHRGMDAQGLLVWETESTTQHLETISLLPGKVWEHHIHGLISSPLCSEIGVKTSSHRIDEKIDTEVRGLEEASASKPMFLITGMLVGNSEMQERSNVKVKTQQTQSGGGTVGDKSGRPCVLTWSYYCLHTSTLKCS